MEVTIKELNDKISTLQNELHVHEKENEELRVQLEENKESYCKEIEGYKQKLEQMEKNSLMSETKLEELRKELKASIERQEAEATRSRATQSSLIRELQRTSLSLQIADKDRVSEASCSL